MNRTKMIMTIVIVGLIVCYAFISVTGTDVFSLFSGGSDVPLTKLTLDDPVSGKDIINDLESIGCNVYEGTLTGCTVVDSYNAFLSAVRGKDVLLTQSVTTVPCYSHGGLMRTLPQPRIKLSFGKPVLDVGSIIGPFSVHIEEQRFVMQGFPPTREVIPPTSSDDTKVYYRNIPGREPTLVGTYVFFDGELVNCTFSRTSKIIPAGNLAPKPSEYHGYFRFSFNTNEFSDGQHSIKIMATNVDGINETQTIKFVAISEPTSAVYELEKNSFGSGPYWEYNRFFEEKVKMFSVEDKIMWAGRWYEVIDGTIVARESALSTKRIGW